MGTRTARALRGFAIMDPRFVVANLATNDGTSNASDYEQAGPRPGSPVPSDARSFLLPHVHNGQDADLDLEVLRQGEPGIEGVAVIYREDGETDISKRGWNEPNLVTGYAPLAFTSTEVWTQVDAVTIPSTQKVIVVAADQDATAREAVSSWTWSPQTRTWGSRVELKTTNDGVVVAAAVFPDTERVVAWFVQTNVSSTLDAYYLDPEDSSWTQYASDCLGGLGLDPAVDQIRAAVDRHGHVLLLAVDNATGDLWVYRSTDRGLNFVEVDSQAAWGAFPQIVRLATDDLLVTYCDAGTQRPSWCLLEDAYDTIGAGTEIIATAADMQTTWVDADGAVYTAWRENANPNRVRLHRSVADGATWTEYDYGLISRSSASDRWQPRAAASSGGESLLLLTADQAPVEGTEGSLVAVRLGGWATLEAAPTFGARTARYSGGYHGTDTWQRTFLPTGLLVNDGWVGVGGAETLVGGYHRWLTAGGTASSVISFTHQTGVVTFFAEYLVASGGSLVARQVGGIFRRANGVYDYRLELHMSAAGFRLFDPWVGGGAGAYISGPIALDMTALVEFAVQIDSVFRVEVLYKRPSSSVWISAGAAVALTDGGASAANDAVSVGCLGISTAECKIGLLTWLRGMYLQGTAGGGALTPMRWGKPLSSRPYPVRDQGPATAVLHLSGDGGAGRFGETFDLPALYDHGIDRLFPTVAPSRTQFWQATTAAEQVIAFDFGGPTSLDGSMTWAFALCDVNFRTAAIEVRTSPGAWTSLGTWDAATGFTTLTFGRSGDVVTVGAGSAAGGRYIQAGELVGGFIIFDPAGTPIARKIVWNSGGVWRDATTKKPLIRFEGYDGSEPSSGTLHLCAPSGVLIVPQASGSTFERIRLRVPAQDTVDDEPVRVGSFFGGAVMIAGRQWSRGWSIRYLQNVDEEEDDYGTLFVDERGPQRRELTVAWQDGYDLTAIRGGGDLNYLSPSVATNPLAADSDVWFNVAAMMRLGRSGAVPSLALMSIPSVATMVTDPTQWLQGPLMGRVQVNHVQGDEGVSEVVRVESLTLREQV